MAGQRILGFATATETSLTKKGMNPHAKKVLTKSAEKKTPEPAPEPVETTEMSIKSLLRVAAMSDVTKSYFVGLGAEDDGEKKAEAFLAKSDADQDAEAAAAHDVAEKAKAAALEAAEKAKAGDPEIAELKKSNANLTEQVKSLLDKDATAAIEKRAKDDFPGVPDAVDVLKSISSLSAELQEPVLKSLKSRAELAKKISKTFGLDTIEGEGSALAEYNAKVDEVVKAKSITKSAAILEIDRDPANADLIERYRAESNPAAAA